MIKYAKSTWTPKKGKVAEPGFWGQAPGKGVICKENKWSIMFILNGRDKELYVHMNMYSMETISKKSHV